jgi:sugar-specific transcriptional regulator TrmB
LTTDLLEALVELGLTNSEAKVYLATARLGAATATEIAAVAEKERSNAHHLLQRLEQLGLVATTLDSPMKFKPIEPRDAIDHLFELQTVRFKKLEEMKSSTLTSLAPAAIGTPPNKETFSVVRGRVRTYLRVIGSVTTCESNVSLLMSSNGLIRLSRFRNFVQLMGEKAEAGVKFRVVTEITKSNAEYARIMGEMAEVRHVRNQTTNASVYDMKVGSVALSINDALEEDIAEHVALWSNGASFVKMLESLFDSAWFLAAPAGPTMKSMGLRP